LSKIFEKADKKDERNKRMLAAHMKYGYSLKDLADHLGIHYSRVSEAIKELGGELIFQDLTVNFLVKLIGLGAMAICLVERDMWDCHCHSLLLKKANM
jgi:AraC-like DNA-binding protein